MEFLIQGTCQRGNEEGRYATAEVIHVFFSNFQSVQLVPCQPRHPKPGHKICLVTLLCTSDTREQQPHFSLWKQRSIAACCHKQSYSGSASPVLSTPKSRTRFSEDCEGGLQRELVCSGTVEMMPSRSGLNLYVSGGCDMLWHFWQEPVKLFVITFFNTILQRGTSKIFK